MLSLSAPPPPSFATPRSPSSLDLDLHQAYSTPVGDLPNTYIWPELDRPSSIHEDLHISPSNSQIPIVDLSEGNTYSLVEKLHYACENWGVFYVVNHGVPLELMDAMMEKSMKLFSLPLEAKLRVLRKDGTFEGYGKPVIGKFFTKSMWIEGFTMMGHPTTSIADVTNRLCIDEDNNDFRETFEAYDLEMKKLAGNLLHGILMGLGVDMDKFQRQQFIPKKDCHAALQLNHYPPCPEPSKTMGLPSHTDSTCLTILNPGEVAGLEIFAHGKWTILPPLQASFLVHVGDMLQIISNDKYKSVVHRAITNKTRHRLSIAYLCGPPPSTVISPPEEVVHSSSNQLPVYGPLKWIEFLKAKSEHFMGTLDYLKSQWLDAHYF